MRSGGAAGLAAALVLLAAVSWLAPESGGAAGDEDGEAEVRVSGVVLREEFAVAAPAGEYLPLVPDGTRVAAGGAVLASGETAEDLAAAFYAAGQDDPAVWENARRLAALAAASGRPELALPLAALMGDAAPAGEYELVRSPQSALWTTYTDGYEALNAASAALDALPEPASGGYAGKLVTGARWYFLAAVTDGRLTPGAEVELRFDGFAVSARVLRASGGETLFMTAERPEAALDARFCEAGLVF